MKQFFAIFCVLVVVACSPREQAPAPRQEQSATEQQAINMRAWLPKGKPKAVILALHGFNDYSLAFESTGQYFKKRGIAVYAYDQRGFGQASEPGIWGGKDNLIADVHAAMRQISAKHPKAPIYLLGESMGGAIAINALVSENAPRASGLILSAPALWGQDALNPIYRGALWSFAHTMPGYKLTGSDLKILATNNYPVLRRMGADPLIIKATRVDAIYGLVQLMDAAYLALPEVKSRTLILYGREDQVIPAGAMNRALPRFTTPLDIAYYPDGYHMLLRDIQGRQVMADIESWIRRPKAPLPSGFGGHYLPSDNR